MNLDKAYQQWGQQNDTLYYKTRKIFSKVWWLIPTNKACSFYTLLVLGRALQQANAEREDKVQAASVMLNVLSWAHQMEPELNPKPSFSLNDLVDYEGENPSPLMRAIEQAEEVQAAHIEKILKAESEAKTKRGNKPVADFIQSGRPVVQLDPKTLRPIKTWASAHAASKELGIQNIQRAIDRRGMAGGFFWCRPGNEKGYKPAPVRTGNNTKPAPTPSAPAAAPEAARGPLLEDATDEQLLAEIRRRDWKGHVTITKTIEF